MGTRPCVSAPGQLLADDLVIKRQVRNLGPSWGPLRSSRCLPCPHGSYENTRTFIIRGIALQVRTIQRFNQRLSPNDEKVEKSTKLWPFFIYWPVRVGVYSSTLFFLPSLCSGALVEDKCCTWWICRD